MGEQEKRWTPCFVLASVFLLPFPGLRMTPADGGMASDAQLHTQPPAENWEVASEVDSQRTLSSEGDADWGPVGSASVGGDKLWTAMWPWTISDERGEPAAGDGGEQWVAVGDELRRLGAVPEARFRPGRAALVQGAAWYQACQECGVSACSWRAAAELWRCKLGDGDEDGSGARCPRTRLSGVCGECGLDVVWAEWVGLLRPWTAPLPVTAPETGALGHEHMHRRLWSLGECGRSLWVGR